MYIADDNTPEEEPEIHTAPPDDVKQPDPSPRDVSSECEEVDYDTDFEDASLILSRTKVLPRSR